MSTMTSCLVTACIMALVFMYILVDRDRRRGTVSRRRAATVVLAAPSRKPDRSMIMQSDHADLILNRLRAQISSNVVTVTVIRQQKDPHDEPEVISLMSLSSQFHADPERWDCLLAVGDIYRSGAFPRLRPSINLAEKCFKTAAMCPDGAVAGMAQVKFMQCRDEPLATEDIASGPLAMWIPEDVGHDMCALALERIMRLPSDSFQRPMHRKKEHMTTMTTTTNTTKQKTDVPAFKRDAQNVHDHGVTSAAGTSLARLRAATEPVETLLRGRNLVDTVAARLAGREDLTMDQRLDAIRTLDHLNSHLHSTLNISEQDALALVWDRITSRTDAQLVDNLVGTLGAQLATAVENGAVVCSSGRISRILGALEGVDDETVQTARPMWAIREELGALAAKVRDDVLAAASPRERDLYESGQDTDDRVEARMKDMYQSRARETYCIQLGMLEKVLRPFLDENMEAF